MADETQPLCTQYIMEISNIVEILEMDVFQKAVQADQPFMTVF